MISSDLLRYKIDYKNKKIYPILCTIDNNSSEYQLAKKIIEIFDECYANKYNKNKLNYMIKLLEYSQKDYKLIRGLYSILEKKCIFKPVFENEKEDTKSDNPDPLNRIIPKLTPAEIRRTIFQESALNNIAVDEDKRFKILEKVSNELNTNIKTIIKLMWADLEENTIINKYSSPDPQLLLLYYNISLIQTLLFNCLRIEIKINSMKSIGLLWKVILREIKRLGLMYWLEIDPSNTNNNDKKDIICIVEGASNIIKLTEKYGNSIAKLVPLIFKATNWSIKADILRTASNGNKTIYCFETSEQLLSDKISTKILKKIQESHQYQEQQEEEGEEENYEKIERIDENKIIFKDELFSNNKSFDDNNNTVISYDSNIEKTFAKKFELFNTGWAIEREPEPLITKLKTAFISDFLLSKHQNKVLVEIIGFWTKEYLERKIQKIIQIIENYNNNNFYMILIINFDNLAMYETNQNYSFSNIKNKSNILIISYKNDTIPFKEIIPFLKKIERKYIEKNLENKADKDKIIQEINEILKEFKILDKTKNTLEEVNKIIVEKQKNVDPSFNLKEALENNQEFKSIVEKKIIENKLIMVKDFIFKEPFIKEIYSGLKDKEINNLKEACDLLTSKNIPEKIHIDLLIFMGFEIYWNGLDYSESKINLRSSSSSNNNNKNKGE
jgi:uncharacterized protein